MKTTISVLASDQSDQYHFSVTPPPPPPGSCAASSSPGAPELGHHEHHCIPEAPGEQHRSGDYCIRSSCLPAGNQVGQTSLRSERHWSVSRDIFTGNPKISQYPRIFSQGIPTLVSIPGCFHREFKN